jgi:glycosyltransferase involved in cell wall biosynthesis
MRILQVSSSGELGGAERILLELAAGMRARGHDVALISGDDGPLIERAAELGSANVLPFPRRFASLGESGRRRAAVAASLPLVAGPVAGYIVRFRAAVKRWAPDVVHTHGVKAHVVASCAGGAPVVWHMHEYVSTRPVSARLLGACSGRASGAIAISGSIADDVARVSSGLRCWTIPNAVDLQRFTPDGAGADLDAAAGLPPAAPGTVRVGLVATYAWWKGHDVFLRAMARIGTRVPVRGYIVGGPVYRTGAHSQVDAQTLMRSIDAHGLGQHVGLTGFVEDVPGVMRALDIVVHASIEPEPFGLVIAEAMASGRAVIVSDAGGAAEIVRNGIDAIATAPGDDAALAERIEELVRDEERRRRIGSAARQSASERFDRQRMLESVEDVYRQVAAS